MEIRAFRESDRAAALALGGPIIGAWHRGPSLHLVAAEDRVIGHLQVADRGVPGSRSEGRADMILRVAPDLWEGDLPTKLLHRTIGFARERGLDRIAAACLETEPDIAAFLLRSGFAPLERFLPSRLRLTTFDPAQHRREIPGIEPLTLAKLGDTPENRRRVYELEQAARAVQPFREPGRHVPPPFEAWDPGAPPEHVFLARSEGRLVGMVSGLDWCFTGVNPDWQGRGIATALKVQALAFAKQEGLEAVETENHEDNAAMIAINRKLGFEFGPVETSYRLSVRHGSGHT